MGSGTLSHYFRKHSVYPLLLLNTENTDFAQLWNAEKIPQIEKRKCIYEYLIKDVNLFTTNEELTQQLKKCAFHK